MSDFTRQNKGWNYDPDRCDGHYCCGDCWWCRYSPDHDGDVDDAEEEA